MTHQPAAAAVCAWLQVCVSTTVAAAPGQPLPKYCSSNQHHCIWQNCGCLRAWRYRYASSSRVALCARGLRFAARCGRRLFQAQAVHTTEQAAAVIENRMAMNALARGDVNSFVALQHDASRHQANANAIAQQANANAMQQRLHHQWHHQGGF